MTMTSAVTPPLLASVVAILAVDDVLVDMISIRFAPFGGKGSCGRKIECRSVA
jgi:hypothetical protein